ncbi:MAG: sodium:proton antiporter [Patescibacteria group bacterium]
MLTAESAFALFLMLAIASVVYYIANRFKLPFTVLLTFVGILLVPLSTFETFSFLREFQLTPELLFFIFLPTLLFESAYNMNIRRVVDDIKPILLLAIFGYLLSSFLIGGGLWFFFDLIGLSVPFMVTLLFGALISATDPVAVLALFKEFGAPRRLTLIFEGESLLNDATALALFVIVLGLIESGATGAGLALGGVTFFTMLVGGTLLGFLVATLFAQLMNLFRNNEIVAITIMIVVAHSTFLLAELLNHEFRHVGLTAIQFSPIIATTAAAILMGNYSRFKLRPSAEEFVEKFWGQFAFMANSLVFILVGFLFASVPDGAGILLLPVIIAVLVVALSRALSIYVTIIPFNVLFKNERIPLAWQHLLSWGSLRGALAVMLVLLVPADLTVPGWSLAIGVQDFLLVLTVACIFVTLFLKAPLIGPMMRRLNVGNLNELELVARSHAEAIVEGTIIEKVKTFSEKGYIPTPIAQKMISEHERELKKVTASFQGENTQERQLSTKVLGLYIIGHEKQVLKELLTFDEVNERVFKRVYGKLVIQAEAIESGAAVNPSMVRDYRDLFENGAEWVRSLFVKSTSKEGIRQDYLYYRTQALLAKKVLKELRRISEEFSTPVFDPSLIEEEKKRFEEYLEKALAEKQSLRSAHTDIIEALDVTLAHRSVYRIEDRYLERLHHREMLTPKLFITLRDKYEKEEMMEKTVTQAALQKAEKKRG